MEWYEVAGRYHERTFASECALTSLPRDWQRELAALWRLEADVNNGGYMQFFVNWGRESYVYANRALKKIGAVQMSKIIEQCQTLLDEQLTLEQPTQAELESLLPNQIIGRDGAVVKDIGSVLPDRIIARLDDLSYGFMNYPEDIAKLGMKHYRRDIESDE